MTYAPHDTPHLCPNCALCICKCPGCCVTEPGGCPDCWCHPGDHEAHKPLCFCMAAAVWEDDGQGNLRPRNGDSRTSEALARHLGGQYQGRRIVRAIAAEE